MGWRVLSPSHDNGGSVTRSRLSEWMKWLGITEDPEKPQPKWLFILVILVVVTVLILMNR